MALTEAWLVCFLLFRWSSRWERRGERRDSWQSRHQSTLYFPLSSGTIGLKTEELSSRNTFNLEPILFQIEAEQEGNLVEEMITIWDSQSHFVKAVVEAQSRTQQRVDNKRGSFGGK